MSTQETFQIPLEAAEAYERSFVPAIFAEWAPHTVEAARVATGASVLDVACGTGIVARTAADIVGPTGEVVGIDLNDAMIEVARRVRPDIDYRQGDAHALPFEDDRFDAVTCQMALMFMADLVTALAEMARVARPGATVGLNVPASLDAQPAYRVLVDIAARHAGPDAISLLGTYWNRGDLDALTSELVAAGLPVDESRTRTGTARFASAEAFVRTEVEGSPLAERLTSDELAAMIADVSVELESYSTPTGFEIPLVCHIVSARPGS